MQTRKTTLKPDPRGDYRPYIGYRKDGKQQRFNLGSDLTEAERRRDRIQALYAESVAARRCYALQPSWTEAALYAAKLIEEGLQQIPLPEPKVINEACGCMEIGNFDPCWHPLLPEALVWSHGVASRHYPSVNWLLPEGRFGAAAVQYGQQIFDMQARRQAKLLGAETPTNPVHGAFYEALDKYTKYLEETLAETLMPGSVFNRVRYVSYFKIRHTDFPLLALDFNKCDELISFWKNRPTFTKNVDSETESTDRYIHKTARQILAELDRFFDWLDFRGGFGWSKPRHFDNIDRTVTKDPVKRSIKNLISKPTFSLEELSKINMECDPLQRMLLYFGLNCAFGASEVGRLEFDDLYLRKANPLEHCWHNQNYKADPSESWVAFLRPKTGVAGCWWLFPETVDAIEAWLKVRPKTDVQRIVVSEVGTSLYRDKSKNAQSGFGNQWRAFLKRVIKKHPALSDGKSIRLLPFGTLRDQLPDWAVGNGESESGSIALAHGCPFKDDLLTCYSNRPFPRMFDVQRRYREFLEPVFDAVKGKK